MRSRDVDGEETKSVSKRLVRGATWRPTASHHFHIDLNAALKIDTFTLLVIGVHTAHQNREVHLVVQPAKIYSYGTRPPPVSSRHSVIIKPVCAVRSL